MIVLQDRQPTKRQNALEGFGTALGQAFTSYVDAGQKAAETKRQQALKDEQMALTLNQAGFAGTVDDYRAALKDPGLMKAFQLNRTDDYTRKQNREDAKYKQEKQDADLDRDYKRAQIKSLGADSQRKSAETFDITSGNRFKREINQDQVKDLAKKNASIFTVKSGIDSSLKQLQDPNLSEAEKIKVGQETMKLLNSAEGADAVGAEEAQRLGSYLEYALGNVTGPGGFRIGRDLEGFTEQIKNNSSRLAERMRRNEEGISGLSSGRSLVEIASQNQPVAPNQVALSPLQFNGQQPSVNFSPTNIPNISPVQNAVANDLKAVDSNSLASRREQLLKKKGMR
jgi:hypothetical protein